MTKHLAHHGLSWMPEYKAWSNMIRRCTNPRCKDWSKYGGRGITVCERWRNSFLNFLEDVGEKPSIFLLLERFDNNRGYEPGNVGWATSKEQQNNRRPIPKNYKCSRCHSVGHNMKTCSKNNGV